MVLARSATRSCFLGTRGWGRAVIPLHSHRHFFELFPLPMRYRTASFLGLFPTPVRDGALDCIPRGRFRPVSV